MLDFIGLLIAILIYAFIIFFPLLIAVYIIFTPIRGLSWQIRVAMGLSILIFLAIIMWLMHGDNIKGVLEL